MAITTPYLQNSGASSTLDAIESLLDQVEPSEAFFSFAYVTESGLIEFERRIGKSFLRSTPTKWLVGIDYGRSQPKALKSIDAKPKAKVRVFAGVSVVARRGFLPNPDFHMKSLFVRNPSQEKYGLLAGSGNFSRNGLVRSSEFGVSVFADDAATYAALIQPTYDQVKALWKKSDRLAVVLPQYTALWTPGSRRPPQSQPPAQAGLAGRNRFWIEAGYVTKNRGSVRPGNQIDMPRGFHRFFGLNSAANQPLNSVIGAVTFDDRGRPLTRDLRLGNNAMEKISLPMPERYPFQRYDGKVIVFTRANGRFSVDAYELEEFSEIMRQAQDPATFTTASGRTYGYL